MTSQTKHILIVEDNEDYAGVLKDYLLQDEFVTYEVQCVDSLAGVRSVIESTQHDVILLDLFLSDSRGFETVEQVQQMKPGCPIVILSAWEDAKLAMDTIRAGVQDYLFKNEALGSLLSKCLRHAMERYRIETVLRRDAFYDELTGIYNRKGFRAHAKPLLKLAARQQKPISILFFDLDGLKQINDTHGHLQGDYAIRSTAHILQKTFRDSDIVARFGGDEFAALAFDASEKDAEAIVSRMNRYLEQFNRKFSASIGVSYGIATTQGAKDCGEIEHLIAAADEDLYRMKYQRKNLRQTGT